MIRVALAQDIDLVQDGLVRALDHESDLDVVATVAGRDEVLDLVANTRPDVLLLDVGMPERSGLDMVARCHSAVPETAVLMLIALDEPNYYAGTAIVAGARGCLRKSSGSQEVVDAIRRVHAGDIVIGTHQLTQQEIDVLRLSSQGYRAADIAEDLCLAEGTVRSYMTSVLRKLSLM